MRLDLDVALERLTQLQTAMGILHHERPELPDIDWSTLSDQGIDVESAEIVADREEILRYRGQAVVVYIRDQYQHPKGEWSRYTYHLTDCPTLQRMTYSGRADRYTVTNRTDGWFVCTYGKGAGRQSRALRMKLCRNCLRNLDFDAYAEMSPRLRESTTRDYDLVAHFYTYQNVGHTPPVPQPVDSATSASRHLASTPGARPSSGPARSTLSPRPSPASPAAPAPASHRYRPVTRTPKTKPARPDTTARQAIPPAPAPAPPPSPPPTRPALLGLPDWVPRDTDEQFQAALLHIDRHGSITEPELAQMLGGARRVRRFARALPSLTDAAPYNIQRSSRAGVSTFRRQRR